MRLILPFTPAALGRIVGAALLIGIAVQCQAAPFSRTSTDGPLSVTATLDKETAQIAEPLSLTLTIDAPADVAVTLPAGETKIGAFHVLKTTDSSDIPTATGRQWIRRYELESLTPGQQPIPSIAIAYADRRNESPISDLAQSPEFNVTIVSALEGTPDPLQFRDIKGAVELPAMETANNVWLYGSIGSGVCLALAGGALLLWPSRTSRRSPKDQALAELAALKRCDLLKSGQTELFYVRLTNIVRQYVERQFAIAAPRLTTDEFLAHIASSSVLDDSRRGMLRSFLTLADLVKFAQFDPGRQQADEAIDRADQFIRQSAAAKSPVALQENA